MKKFLLLIVCLFAIIQVSFAENITWTDKSGNAVSGKEVVDALGNSFLDVALQEAKKLEPVYNKMLTCEPAKYDYLEVFGIEKGKCHFYYVNYDCFVPKDVATRYAQASLAGVAELKKGNFSTSAVTPEGEYIQSVLGNKSYCSYSQPEPVWEVEYSN